MDTELIEKDCKIIGGYDVEKLAEKSYSRVIADDNYSFKRGYEIGFKTAQSLNDKKFSLEDILDAWELGAREGLPLTKKKKDKIIQSLQQTSGDVEVEMEYQDMHGMWFTKPTILSELDRPSRPKITNNLKNG